MAVDTPGLAAHQLGHVGVFLLRHDGRAGAEAVGQFDEIELGTGPDHQFFGKTRQVHQDQAGGRTELDGEIAIAHRIQGVLADRLEAQLVGHEMAIQRIDRARQRGRAERQDIHAPAAVGEPFPVPAQHGVPRHEVMTEGDRLGNLQVSEARHQSIRFALGQIEQAGLQAIQLRGQGVDGVAQIEADVRCHLVVA